MTKRANSILVITIICVVLIICLIWIVLTRPFLILTKGMVYIAEHGEKYDYIYHPINENIEFTINIKDLSSNVGKVIYQKDGCRIEISDIDENNYRIFFQTYVTYNLNSATLISAVKHEQIDSNKYKFNCIAKLNIKDNNTFFECSVAGLNGLCYKNGDTFGYYIFSEE